MTVTEYPTGARVRTSSSASFFLFVDVVASLLRCFASSSSVVWRESILSGIALGKKSSSSE